MVKDCIGRVAAARQKKNNKNNSNDDINNSENSSNSSNNAENEWNIQNFCPEECPGEDEVSLRRHHNILKVSWWLLKGGSK